jgi:8-oxo-dGTP pyrophosphatase MutT (NUDIX family)
MADFPTVEELDRALRGRATPPVEGDGVRPAGVLVCLHEGHVLLVRRAIHPADPWSGHVGLPGGRHDASDADLLQTALRETREEVGFDPCVHGRVLGAVGEQRGRGRRVAGLRIGVFVAALDSYPPLMLSPEVASAHWVSLAALRPLRAEVAEWPEPVPAYRVPGGPGQDELVVWGITFAILERVRSVTDGSPAPPARAEP